MGFKHIFIIHPEGNATNNPTINCLINFFLDQQFKITYIISGNPNYPSIEGVTLINRSEVIEKLKRKLFNKYCLIFPSKLFSFIRNLNSFKKYDLIVSVDREGLIEASTLSQFLKVPLLHLSFEIYFASETSKKFKKIEIEASKRISHLIVQDEIRAQALIEENHLLNSCISHVPVSSKGLGEYSAIRLRDDLGIPLNKKVAIFMGSLYPWTMFKQVIEQVGALPNDWVIIVNERYGQANQYLLELGVNQSLIDSKVYVSNVPVESVDKMGYVLSGIDAGLAFYNPTYDDPSTGQNLVKLGLASGKISTYLRYGVPIVVNDIGLISDMTRKQKFGVVVENLAKLPNALLDLDNMKNASDNAKKFFNERLDFSLYQDEFKSVIDSLIDMPD